MLQLRKLNGMLVIIDLCRLNELSALPKQVLRKSNNLDTPLSISGLVSVYCRDLVLELSNGY